MAEHDFFSEASSWGELAAGGAAGLSEHLVMFPFDTARTRMQQQPDVHRTVLGTIRHIVKQETPRHLYRGCLPVACSAVPAHAAYFGCYETTKRLLVSDTAAVHAAAAVVATTAHDACSVPFDVVKQRMQTDATNKFSSSISCARHLLRTEGAGSLFASLPTTVTMNIPMVATQWIVYERCKKLLGLSGDEDLSRGYLVAGFTSGTCAALASMPLDVVKTHLQLGERGAIEVARNLFRQRGLAGFYTGVTARVLQMAPSSAIVMTTYEGMKRLLCPPPPPPTSSVDVVPVNAR